MRVVDVRIILLPNIFARAWKAHASGERLMARFLNLDGLALNTEQGKWKRTAEAVARDTIRPNAERIDREGCFPVENIRALGEAGLLGLLVPKEQ